MKNYKKYYKLVDERFYKFRRKCECGKIFITTKSNRLRCDKCVKKHRGIK